ncbi:METTL21A_1 [Blepharisma stoltei]|uniref:Uncharacterized protein n=1 Tax=Blepharisma stoltei TaxID=1481888 RepID=A0AAU9KI34_9CILI|nr:unnamed protein product [Blepharisma stoltei]
MEGKIVHMGQDDTSLTEFYDVRYVHDPVLLLDDLGERIIRINQDWKLGICGQLWDASYVVSRFIKDIDFRGKKVLELGAGTALPSIVACIGGGEVYTTDIMPGLKLSEQNLEENKELFTGSYLVSELDWRNEEQREILKAREYDYIVFSDLFYLPSLANDFCNTLHYLCSEKTQVIMTYKFRVSHTINPYLEGLQSRFEFQYNDEFVRSVHNCSSIRLALLRKI